MADLYRLKEGTWIKDVRVLDRDPLAKRAWWANTAEVLREKGVDERNAWRWKKMSAPSAPSGSFGPLLPRSDLNCDEIFQLARMIKEPEENQDYQGNRFNRRGRFGERG